MREELLVEDCGLGGGRILSCVFCSHHVPQTKRLDIDQLCRQTEGIFFAFIRLGTVVEWHVHLWRTERD